MTLALVLAAVLAVCLVLFVARPFLREPEAADDALETPERGGAAPPRARRGARPRAAALKELEFDHRTGKVSDEDYRALVGPLRREAAEALKALDQGRDAGPGGEHAPDGP